MFWGSVLFWDIWLLLLLMFNWLGKMSHWYRSEILFNWYFLVWCLIPDWKRFMFHFLKIVLSEWKRLLVQLSFINDFKINTAIIFQVKFLGSFRLNSFQLVKFFLILILLILVIQIQSIWFGLLFLLKMVKKFRRIARRFLKLVLLIIFLNFNTRLLLFSVVIYVVCILS